MINQTLIFLDPRREDETPNDWPKIGLVVTELSEIYQKVKESQVDLILIDDSRSEVKRSVAAKIRRFNGLTEIWLMTSDDFYEDYDAEYIDGSFSRYHGFDKILRKVENILKGKKLLAKYGIIGRSARMKAVAETIDRVAKTEVPVMVVGPSGSGKELVANALHRYSNRAKNPFVAINCGALAEGVLESELFGHERGAFTGSVSKREGLFFKAEGGSIFLDEIGETKPDTQVKLLRVLEDGTYYPVGSSIARHADVRLISATNRDLNEAIAEKEFREDLYFRIGVVKVVVPSLLERKGDIQPLLSYFWEGNKKLDYSDAALDLLIKYDWPGNVRQLRNFADRMVALKPRELVKEEDVQAFINEQHTQLHNLPVSTGRTVEEAGQELIYRAILQMGSEIKLLRDLITSHLPGGASEDQMEVFDAMKKGGTMEQMEEMMIRQVLEETSGNRKEAAKKLGIGERTLYRKLKKYNLR